MKLLGWSVGVLAAMFAAWPACAQSGGSPGLKLPSRATAAPLGAQALFAPVWRERTVLLVSGGGLGSGLNDQLIAANGDGLKVRGVRVLEDYFFSPTSGFRATGGMIGGSSITPWLPSANPLGSARSLSLSVPRLGWGTPVANTVDPLDGGSAATSTTVPYVGAGFSGPLEDGAWRFSADLGLISRNPGSASKIGRVLTNGLNSVDDMMHDMRLQPMVQVGLSYSF
ncbi:hypothetical protein [Aquabacterium sp.]|uniref:hypothetical protein n=1 Tax=Aquabacterium sp. TaxID=1872578 RepID=UPI0035AF8892